MTSQGITPQTQLGHPPPILNGYVITIKISFLVTRSNRPKWNATSFLSVETLSACTEPPEKGLQQKPTKGRFGQDSDSFLPPNQASHYRFPRLLLCLRHSNTTINSSVSEQKTEHFGSGCSMTWRRGEGQQSPASMCRGLSPFSSSCHLLISELYHAHHAIKSNWQWQLSGPAYPFWPGMECLYTRMCV